MAAADRIFEILDTKPSVMEKKDAVILPRIKDGIILEGACFNCGEKEILKDVNIEGEAGR